MRETRADMLLIKLLYLSATGIVAFQVLNRPSISSSLFTLTFIIILALWLVSLNQGFDSLDLLTLLIVTVATISVLTNSLITHTSLSFQYLKKLIIFICTIVLFDVCIKTKIGVDTGRLINITITAATLLPIAMYIINPAQTYMFKGVLTRYLTFGFTNPNLTAMFLTMLTIISVVFFTEEKRAVMRLLRFFIIVTLVFFLIKTQTRNCHIAFATFVFNYLYILVKQNLKMPKWLIAVISVLPLIFMLVYMLVIDIKLINHMLSFMVSSGKELASRVSIWSNALDQIAKSPVFGAYSQLSGKTGVFQLHNSHLDILASYGCLDIILVCIFLYKIMSKMNAESTTKSQWICFAGFVTALLTGMGEAALFSGGLGINIFASAFLLLFYKESLTEGAV